MIEGISHITFIVKDLELASDFFKVIFEAQEVYSSGDKLNSLSQEKFLSVGDTWICIMIGDSMPDKTYNHCAFKIDDKDFDLYIERIESLGLSILTGRPRVHGEGRSIYFHDYDNHLFELHTGTLEERLESYKDKQ